MAGTMSVEEAIAEQSDEPTEEEKKKAENEAFWANLKEQASEKSKKEAQAKHQQAKDESPSGDPFADALVRLSKQAGNKALIDQYVAEQGVVPYSQHVEMDPAYAQSLKGMEQYLSGEYEERLRREGAAQIMQGQQLQSQIGQTTQAMGSRGMGRVAQLGAASKTDMMAQLQMNIDQAARDAFQAQKEASVEMRNIMMANLEQQKALHGWEDDDITLAQNQADGWIQAQQNLMSLMITEGRLETAEQWEAFGMWSGKAYQELSLKHI